MDGDYLFGPETTSVESEHGQLPPGGPAGPGPLAAGTTWPASSTGSGTCTSPAWRPAASTCASPAGSRAGPARPQLRRRHLPGEDGMENGNVILDPIELTRQAIQSDIPEDATAAPAWPAASRPPRLARRPRCRPGHRRDAGRHRAEPDAAPQRAAVRATGRHPPASPDPATTGGSIRLAVATTLADTHHWDDHPPGPGPLAGPDPAGQLRPVVSGGSDAIAIDLPDPASRRPGPAAVPVRSRSVDFRATILTALATAPTGKGTIAPVGDAERPAGHGRARHRRAATSACTCWAPTVGSQAMIDLDHPLLASARLWVDNVDFKQISAVFPAVNRVQGTYNLSVAVTPARGPDRAGADPGRRRPAQPGRPRRRRRSSATAGSRSTPTSTRTGAWSAWSARTEQPHARGRRRSARRGAWTRAGPTRTRSRWPAATLRVWARFVRNENEAGRARAPPRSRRTSGSGFRCLDLNQLAHVADVQAPDMPGHDRRHHRPVRHHRRSRRPRRSGPRSAPTPWPRPPPPSPRAAAAGTPRPARPDPFIVRLGRSLYGDGTVKLRNSNLANFGPIAGLYDIMHVGGDKRGPTGYGDVAFRIEGDAMNVTRMHYFNRGVEVRAQARVERPGGRPRLPPERHRRRLRPAAQGPQAPDLQQHPAGHGPDCSAPCRTSAASVQIGGTLHKPDRPRHPVRRHRPRDEGVPLRRRPGRNPGVRGAVAGRGGGEGVGMWGSGE